MRDNNAKVATENAALRRDNARVAGENQNLRKEVEFAENRNGDLSL